MHYGQIGPFCQASFMSRTEVRNMAHHTDFNSSHRMPLDVDRLARQGRRLASLIAAIRARMATRRQLRHMRPHDLKDIGLIRDDAERLTPFSRDAEDRLRRIALSRSGNW